MIATAAPAPSSGKILAPMLEAYILRGRQQRFQRILQTIRRPEHRPLRLLDVGGTTGYWAAMPWQQLAPVEIVLLNVEPQDVSPPFAAVVGDARDLSRYADQSFDVVYSNSVIGHVGGFDDQRRMARELQRVGRQVILQTPNHRFPIDWRTLIPGFHFLPVGAQAWCLQRTRVGRYARVRDPQVAWHLASRVRNLTRRELRLLFPQAAIYAERACAVTKSFIVVAESRNTSAR
jgi:hypothetical protein